MTDDAKLIERFNPSLTCGWADMAQDPEGDYVTYEDHAARLTALIAENERLQGALALLTVRAGSLVFAHHHGNGLEGWHKVIDGVDHALTQARAALSGDEGGV